MNNNFWINNLEFIQATKKVVFITNTYFQDAIIGPSVYRQNYGVYNNICKNMIIGKTYNVIEYYPYIPPNGRFRLEDGYIYPKELFITVEEYRNRQLNKLIECL